MIRYLRASLVSRACQIFEGFLWHARSGTRCCGSATASVPRRRRPQKDPKRWYVRDARQALDKGETL